MDTKKRKIESSAFTLSDSDVMHLSKKRKKNIAMIIYQDGTGEKYYNDGKIYKGQLKNGIPHGSGILFLPGDNTFEGQFADGKAHGMCIYKNKDNTSSYSGTFANGLKHGCFIITPDDSKTIFAKFENNESVEFTCLEKSLNANELSSKLA